MKEGSCEIITGSLGGGKSLLGCEMAMDHFSYGGTVVSNMELYPEPIAKWLFDEFRLKFDPKRYVKMGQETIRDFYNYAMRGTEENTVMMLLDEAALDLNAHDWKTSAREMFDFVVLARKLKIDLRFIAQNATDMDKQLRLKFQRETHCREVFKMFKDWSGIEMPGKLFVRVPYVLTVGQKPWRQRPQWRWGSHAMGCYNSHALHGEKAQLFGALEEASRGKLERVKQSTWPEWTAATVATAASAITTTICLTGV